MRPSRSLPPARSLLRDETEPCRKLACRAELIGIADARHHGGCGNQADPGDLSQPPACCAGGVPGEELLLDRGDLPLDRSDLRGQTLQYLAREIGQTIVSRIIDQFDQLSSTGQALRGDDTEFATVPPQRIDQHRALPNQQFAVRCSRRTDCCSTLLSAVNRIVGRVSASQMASASVASFLFVLT